jgi:hypothetical protein
MFNIVTIVFCFAVGCLCLSNAIPTPPDEAKLTQSQTHLINCDPKSTAIPVEKKLLTAHDKMLSVASVIGRETGRGRKTNIGFYRFMLNRMFFPKK